jgi:hypothetical protein
MSREARENKLRKVWRRYLTKGVRWSREGVAKKVGCRIEDVQRLIDEAGPTKVLQVERDFSRHCCWRPRYYEGQLDAVRNI